MVVEVRMDMGFLLSVLAALALAAAFAEVVGQEVGSSECL